MIRDREIERLINYTKGLGLKITFSSKRSDCCALWYLDNTGIVVYKNHNTTKIDTVLSLLHEICHAIHNIHEKDRKIDSKFSDALNHVVEAEESGMDTQKRQRKIILDNEVAATQYWHSVYRETNLKFPIWRLEMQLEFDIYQYQVFYETGSYPTLKERKAKLKEAKKRHKNKNG